MNTIPKKELRRQLYDRDGKTCDYCKISEGDFLTIWGAFYGGKTDIAIWLPDSEVFIDTKYLNLDWF